MIFPGATLNSRYRLDRKIGEGGFAQVYLANDLQLGRTVAIKLLNTDTASNKDLLARFHLEARSVAALDHPNILTVYDFGTLPDTAFLVMPYVPGGPLSGRLKTSRLSLQEAGDILRQISSALDFAHQNGIVHRDVKPQNILMRNDNRPVLTDFGFAKLLTDAGVEAATQALGTVHYVAPEQIRGKVSSATDQYALGILLYQMITGVLPFSGTAQQILLGHIQRPVPPLIQQPGMQSFPLEMLIRLDRVFGRALAKVASSRYPNCTTLSEAYETAISLSESYQEAEDKTEIAPIRVGRPYEGAKPALNLGKTTADSTAIPDKQQAEDATEVYNSPPVRSTPPPQAYIPPPAAPVMVQPPRLVVRTHPDQRVSPTFDLVGEELALGRELNNKLHLPLSTVSRHHATFYRIGPVGPTMRYRIVDNRSRNQLCYRGQVIHEKILEDGDVIEIGRAGYGEYVVYLTYSAPIFK